MPCAKGMNGCRALCAHRDLVMGYRHARAAAEAVVESVAGGGWAARDDDGVPPLVTFKAWLIASRVPPELRDSA